MAGWRTLGSLVLVLAVVPLAGAQPYPLTENVKAGNCNRIQLTMTLTGELKVNRDGKQTPLKLAATATHEFPERVLNAAANGTIEKAARVYDTAQATITAGDERSQRSLRKDRRLVVAQRHADQYLVYSPTGALTREELELTSEHFDTLALPGLLPGKAVAVGETWKLENAVVQALCSFEGLTEQNLTGKLEEVKDNQARISITGTASGIELGAMVKLTVTATGRFDLGSKRLVGLDWQQKDERDQGPASPATAVETTTKVTRTPIDQPECLGDVALVSAPDGFEPPPPMLQLVHQDPRKRFDLVYGREWQTVGQNEEHLIMRMMEQGDFVAQVTITPWTADGKGKHMTADEFKDAMAKTPGWEPERELQVGEVPVPTEDGRWIYRISALGKMDGIDVMQNFYLVASPTGEQVVLLFTMTPKKAPKLADRDLSMAASIDFLSMHKEPAKGK